MLKKFIFLLIFCTLPLSVSAAELYFVPHSFHDGEYGVAVVLDTVESINVIEAGVNMPPGAIFRRTSDGGSIVAHWVDAPAYDSLSHLVYFSGIIPGGFSGKQGRVLIVYFTANTEISGSFSFDSEKTSLYENSAEPKNSAITSTPIAFAPSVFEEAEQIRVRDVGETGGAQTDNTPPAPFRAYISQDPEMFEGKYYAVFSAKDDLSGVAAYFVAEGGERETKDYSTLAWKPAKKGPYILEVQNRKNYVYVKAVDQAGNEEVIVIAPERKFSTPLSPGVFLFGSIILLIGAVIALIFVVHRYGRAKT